MGHERDGACWLAVAVVERDGVCGGELRRKTDDPRHWRESGNSRLSVERVV